MTSNNREFLKNELATVNLVAEAKILKRIKNVKLLEIATDLSTGCVYSEDVVRASLSEVSPVLYGEVREPSNDVSERPNFINMDKVSHRVSKLAIKNGYVCGTIEILDTAYGNALNKVIKKDFNNLQHSYGFGIRALVKTQPNTSDDNKDSKVISECDIITFDFVNLRD